MNKKLLSFAIAAAVAAPMAANAEATMYGQLRVSLEKVSSDATGSTGNAGIDSLLGLRVPADGWDLVSRTSYLGVKGSEDLGGGLKAIYKMEFGIPVTDSNNSIADGDKGDIVMRNTYVGLAGDWGTFLMGRHDTPLKMSSGKLDLFADTLADYDSSGVGLVNDLRVDNAIAYVSPSFAGFTLSGALVPAGNSTALSGKNVDSDAINSAYSIAGNYGNGPWFASLAYESIAAETAYEGAVDDFDKWRVGLGMLNFNGFTVAGVYENGDHGDVFDYDSWQISLAYQFGNAAIKGMYGEKDFGGDLPAATDLDFETFAVGLDYSLSKRTGAYVLYTDKDSAYDVTDWDGFSVGLTHKF